MTTARSPAPHFFLVGKGQGCPLLTLAAARSCIPYQRPRQLPSSLWATLYFLAGLQSQPEIVSDLESSSLFLCASVSSLYKKADRHSLL